MCQGTPLWHIACSEGGWLLHLAMSLKLFLVLDKPGLHGGKAATPIPSFLHLLQALGLWHLHPQLGSCGALRTTAATSCFSQAMCFMFFISNLTSSNQTTFSPELAEVLVGYQCTKNSTQLDGNTLFKHMATVTLVSAGKVYLHPQEHDGYMQDHKNCVLQIIASSYTYLPWDSEHFWGIRLCTWYCAWNTFPKSRTSNIDQHNMDTLNAQWPQLLQRFIIWLITQASYIALPVLLTLSSIF